MITHEMTNQGDNPFADLPQEMQEKLRATQAMIKSSSFVSAPKIGVKQGGGVYRFPDETEVDRFSAVIIGVKHANKNFPKDYVAGQISPADCAATTKDGDAPNAELISLVESVTRYATHCGSCPRLEWGSNKAGSGRGKLCTEYLIAAVWIPGRDEMYIIEEKKARAAQLESYVASITTTYGLPLRVLTEFAIGVVEGQPYSQSFKVADVYNDATMVHQMASKIDTAEEMLYSSVLASLETPSKEETEATRDTAGPSGRRARAKK